MPAVELFRIRYLAAGALQRERDRVLCLVRAAIPFASVTEVGSTAVKGVVGKQDLDFVARVSRGRFEETRRMLDSHFRRNDRQLSNREYQGYLVPSSYDVAIQLIVANGRYDRFEDFVRFLRRNREARRAYNALKLRWNGRRMDQYRAAKEAFITAALDTRKRSRIPK